MRIVSISDTHQDHSFDIPDGDVLIHGGDFLNRGTLDEWADFSAWFKNLPHEHKILIPGNHDICFEKLNIKDVKFGHLLIDDSVEINGVKIYGSPWTPTFMNWSFMLDRGGPIKEKWDLIPTDTDILVTHGPPHRMGDHVPHKGPVGCKELLIRSFEINPDYHLFGHIHEQSGYEQYENEIQFVNIAKQPYVIDWD